ncbi:MAG: RNA polymerase sigma factor [Gemmataceae bacterium]
MHDGDARLNQIATLWSVVRRAHDDPGEEGRLARQRLLDRYGGAVHRYLLGALRDADAADELAQEFAIRFLQGGLKGVDPARGRFRDFVKGVLFHLVADHHNRKARRERQLPEDAPDFGADCSAAAERDEQFRRSWCEDLFARAWAALDRHEKTAGQPYYTVLRLRAERPGDSSAQLAEELSTRLGKPVNAAGVRKTLERARDCFSDLMLAEIAEGLDDPSRDRLEEELADLGVLEQCRDALARRCGPA